MKINNTILGKFLLFFIGCFTAMQFNVHSQVIQIHGDSLRAAAIGIELITHPWKWQSGDSLSWKDPGIDDSGFRPAHTHFGRGNVLPGWEGIGWFRIKVKLSRPVETRFVGLLLNHDGASEIYWDGKKAGGFGLVGSSKTAMRPDRTPYQAIALGVADTLPHVLAIRYSNYYKYFPEFIGFQTWLGDYDVMNATLTRKFKRNESLLLSVVAQLALIFLHFCLFAFYPKQRLNLYYSLFVLVSASLLYFKYLYQATPDPSTQMLADTLFHCGLALLSLTSAIILYSVGYEKLPRKRLIIIGTITLGFIIYAAVIVPLSNETRDSADYISGNIFFSIVIIDGLRSVIMAIRRGKPGAWVIGVGMFITAVSSVVIGGNSFNLFTDYETLIGLVAYATLVMPVTFSIYLAMDFARTNRNLQTKLEENAILSSQNLAQEQEKNKLILEQADRLEKTVIERTAQVTQQADQLREMDAVKSRFFVNLTHEFRTPLALILGPADQIILISSDRQVLFQANLIRDNANRLMSLINQLLDLSKLEAGKLDLTTEPADVFDLTRKILHSYESLAHPKQISLLLNSPRDSAWVKIDRNKFESVIHNLVSNAVKFSKKGGQVEVEIKLAGDNTASVVILTVRDNGIGIPESKLNFIFDRFYQVDASDSRGHEGTGIGLALTKELVQLMKGSIKVSSQLNQGTGFLVEIPVQQISGDVVAPVQVDQLIPVTTNGVKSIEHESGLPLVLIIEDNNDLRSFIRSVLEHRYRIVDAALGAEGVAIAGTQVPDLVITDLMMPGMDGYEVTRQLKSNITTSHIPVIMLTAKTSTPARVDGWQAGADAYVSKPFEQQELIVLIDNLVETRRKLAGIYSGKTAEASEPLLAPMEQAFLDKAKQTIHEFLDDERLNVDLLAEKLNMSRTQLHRKLKAISDQAPGDMIRTIRLEHAYELLEQNAGTVSEIAYMVGFGNPANFSTSFSRHFGHPPSEVSSGSSEIRK